MTTIAEKCKAAGIAYQTYYLRVKNGMTPEEALSTPLKRHPKGMMSATVPAPEPEDQEPRAPMAYGKYYVFEQDFQKNQQKIRKKNSAEEQKKYTSLPPKQKSFSCIEEFRDRYRITQNTKTKAPARLPAPDEDRESYKVDNYEYVHRASLCYGPIRSGIQSKEPMPWNDADDDKFNRACGGYTAVILNHTKDSEFKYQIYSTNTKKKLYTNDVVRFINQIIKICDPEGKTPFRVIER